MMRRVTRQGAARLALLVALLLVTGCSSTPAVGNSPTPRPTTPVATATATTLALPVHTISLGNFQATDMLASRNGLLLGGTPGAPGVTPTPTSNGADSLYYYSFASHTVETLATVGPTPDGHSRHFSYWNTGGDWLLYTIEGALIPEFWVMNALTRVRHLVGYGTWTIMDDQQVLWEGPQPGGHDSVMWSYDLATGVKRVVPVPARLSPAYPAAVWHGTIAFIKRPPSSNGVIPAGGTVADSEVWLWTPGQGEPVKAGSGAVTGVAFNDQYLVWADPHTLSLTLYDRQTGKSTSKWAANCIRPSIAHDRPYVTCLDFNAGAIAALQLPSGSRTTFATNIDAKDFGWVVDGRQYWLPRNTSHPSTNQVSYVDLPMH